MSWKSLRLCQQAEARWNTIETSAGVYSAAALANLDALITFQRKNGASVIFGMYGTPTFYATATANPTVGDNTVTGPWGSLGEGANPTGNLAAVTSFVTMIMNRYNSAGGAWRLANPTLGKGIQKWETWNEPGANNTSGNAAAFWWGTLAQLVDLCATQFVAIKAVDSTVLVSTPGFSSNPTQLFFVTTGTNTGKTGLQSCDAIAFHPYYATPPGQTFQQYGPGVSGGGDIVYSTNFGIQTIKAAAIAGGYSLPLWITEWGIDGVVGSASNLAWYSQTASFRYNWIARFLMACAAQGVQVVCPWNWGETSNTQGNSGNWQGDTQGVQKAYNDFAAKASGKTISSSSFAFGGTSTLNFSDGSSWTV